MPASVGGAASHGRLLELILSADGLSRQQLLSATGMSRGTLYERLDTLVRHGYVYEAESLAATGGRRSRKMRFDDRGRVILALALGQTHATASVTDTGGSVLRSAMVSHDISAPAKEVLTPLLHTGQALLAQGHAETLVGVGVSLPAPVEAETGHVAHATTIPGWLPDAVVSFVGGVWATPLVVENDARAAALGERADDAETLVYVKVGTGIGCGIVVNGLILRGAHGASGDIGHIRMAPDGPLCRCGRRGCLAAYSSGRAITEQLAASRGFRSIDDLRTAAVIGDADVGQALDIAADMLGRALAATVTTINPDRLVLGGQIGSLPGFVERVQSRVFSDVVDRIAAGLRVQGGSTDDQGAIRGLATLVMRKVFAPETIDRTVGELASA